MKRTPRDIECWLTDKDGVLLQGDVPLPGASDLINCWVDTSRRFLMLTNDSSYTARDLSARLEQAGLIVPEENLWTSALATADFLAGQHPGARLYVVGEVGLTTALHDAGFVMVEEDPDYVVVGETRTYSFEAITMAINHIIGGARFIATNPDTLGTSPTGVLPATGSVIALITAATNRRPYVVGKPNPMMFRSAMNRIKAHSETTAMIGDRMDTDIVAGIEAGLFTVLVLTGITGRKDLERFPYRPNLVVESAAALRKML
ncbi:HAD-IIA family hydrolase [Brooklawnia propionicigenes]|uniref:HAD-IIA family hydrolase n=1 Tax=Brooklawnia propionicigenes TaxID=3041175 RepID=A0AAN0ME95_9ACTN|nr:HAD-IIA family hydrolase [Brooklawnia sp. SH051]BEH00867.1 HAD-IIA family hydrolase [Brooklawnia sp. SH051]